MPERVVTGRVVGIVDNDDRDSDERHRQAEASLPSVRQVAEQVRRNHSRDINGNREHDQPAVDERQSRGNQPNARWGGERKAASA